MRNQHAWFKEIILGQVSLLSKFDDLFNLFKHICPTNQLLVAVAPDTEDVVGSLDVVVAVAPTWANMLIVVAVAWRDTGTVAARRVDEAMAGLVTVRSWVGTGLAWIGVERAKPLGVWRGKGVAAGMAWIPENDCNVRGSWTTAVGAYAAWRVGIVPAGKASSVEGARVKGSAEEAVATRVPALTSGYGAVLVKHTEVRIQNQQLCTLYKFSIRIQRLEQWWIKCVQQW